MVHTFITTVSTWGSREDLKSLGGCWVPHLNAWLVAATERESVRRLRRVIGFDVHLVRLPIGVPYEVRERRAHIRSDAPFRIPSPTAT